MLIIDDVLAQLKMCTTQHLKSLTLRGDTAMDIRALLSNDKLNGLERLNLYWQGTVSLWLPPTEMLAFTSQFTQLRALYLHSPMLSDDLIVILSDQGRAPLLELGIKVIETYVTSLVGSGLPQFEASSWTKLRTHSPCLQVHVKVMSWIKEYELFHFLLPEMEIASINFLEGSKCGDISLIADRFSSTLRKFVDWSFSSPPDEDLLW